MPMPFSPNFVMHGVLNMGLAWIVILLPLLLFMLLGFLALLVALIANRRRSHRLEDPGEVQQLFRQISRLADRVEALEQILIRDPETKNRRGEP
jgi:phage shock protein B